MATAKGSASRARLAQGRDGTEERLLAAIDAAPDDPAPYRVYADWLTERGDPRGEFIAVQHALATRAPGADRRELRRRENALLDAHRAAWLGADTGRVSSYDWFCGFLRGVGVSGSFDLGPVAASPAGRVLRRVACDTSRYGDVVRYAAEQAAAHVGPRLRWFTAQADRYEGWDYDDEDEEDQVPPDVRPLARGCPNLRKLALDGQDLRLGGRAFPALRWFEFRSVNLSKKAWSAIVAANVPELRALVVGFGGFEREADDGAVTPAGAAAWLAPVLSGKAFPKLTRLGVVNAGFTADVVEALATSRLLPRLSVLDLSRGTLDARGAKLLVKYRAKFAHLARLDLRQNAIEVAPAGLDEVCREVLLDDQRDLPHPAATARYAAAIE